MQNLTRNTTPGLQEEPPPGLERRRGWHPPAPGRLDDTGLSPALLKDHVLKIIHYADQPTATHIAGVACLPTNLVLEIIDTLKHQDYCEVVGSTDYTTPADYRYRLTSRGEARAADALMRCRYGGPVPVPIAQYEAAMSEQDIAGWRPSDDAVSGIFQSLVMDSAVRDRLVRALRSGCCTMVFGATGNGKSHVLSEFIGKLDGEIVIPYAIYAHGQIIRMFDPKAHERIAPPELEARADDRDAGAAVLNRRKGRDEAIDRRWVRIKRPGIMVGGEVGPEAVELGYDSVMRFYQAPAHLKAQGGVLVVDDFGRQKVSPADLLNRWIMPLERGRDKLVLRTGEAVDVPFHVTLLFSTNLNPGDLADDAYLRRITYKVFIPSCRSDQFAEILRRGCDAMTVRYDEETLADVAGFIGTLRKDGLNGALARDLVSIVAENSRQEGVQPALSLPAVELAYQQFTGMPNVHSASLAWEDDVTVSAPYLV